MKIVSWNLDRRRNASTWEYLIRELDPDIALLQEVGGPPYEIWDLLDAHHWSFRRPLNRQGQSSRFVTGILTKGRIQSNLTLTSRYPWLQEIYGELFTGNIVACRIALPGGENVNVVSVHLPYWPVRRERLQGLDASEISRVKLEMSRDLWCTEILWSLLEGTRRAGKWIVGGDFNSGLVLDDNSIAQGLGSRGNKEVIDRMNALGLVDCLSRYQKRRVVPTFKTPQEKGTEIRHQLDYVYANPAMLDRLKRAGVGRRSAVFFGKKGSLSDHLPVICEFN